MPSNNEIIYHISIEERTKWDKVVTDFTTHLGSGGTTNHALGNGTIPGFSTNDFTNAEKAKLAGIQAGALNNPHPATHPHTMITGLSRVASSGSYTDLLNIPSSFPAGGGNADTVNGIRISIQATPPSNPKNLKELWINSSTKVISIYMNNTWIQLGAVYL